MNINLLTNWAKKLFWILIIVESISFWSYIKPELMPYAFALLVTACLIASIKKLEWGIYILLSEIFLSSHGRMFSLDILGNSVSIRQGLFAAVFIASIYWLFKNGNFKLVWNKFIEYKSLIFLLVFVGIGIFQGLIQYGIAGSFFDWNSYLFLALIPAFLLVKSPSFYLNITRIIFIVANWLFIKTYIYLYIFSHQINWLDLSLLYKFFRDTRVGEITYVTQNFYRIFMPAQIFAVIAFLLVLLLLVLYKQKKLRLKNSWFAYLTIFTTSLTVMASFSRSNWLGLFIALIFLFLYLLFKFKIPKLKLSAAIIMLLAILFINIGFMYTWTGSWQQNIVSSRIDSLDEAAFSSRTAQLKPLTYEIIDSPVWGYGFGKSVTYRSDDPRIKNEDNTSGIYTTSAFEWGYLDIWLKIGLFGLLAYLGIIYTLLRRNLKYGQFEGEKGILRGGFAIGLLVVCIISIFSPYMNHPLGFSILLINMVNE
ncbi:O-antigen ligase family protein [Patescibacteria group bacterium]|nr:O-antigen ligase family protein [Patescibacteria group bacterium]